MSHSVRLTQTIPFVRTSIHRLPFACSFVFIALAPALIWFTLALSAQAVDPPPDGGYPGNNTAEGTDALFSLTGGAFNTAIGFDALYSNTIGGTNTAVGD